MTDVTRHLGEIMGQSPAERAAAESAAQDEARWAASHPPAGSDSAQSASDASTAQSASDGASQAASGPAPIDSIANGTDHATAVAHAAAHGAHHGADLSAYAFPFSAREVFGLLPDSIGGKVESLWQYAQNFSDQTPSVTMAITAIVLVAILIAIISTARVWRRGPEVAVAGFGDHLTRTGTRYTVRQEAPPRLTAGRKTLGSARTPAVALAADVPPTENTAEIAVPLIAERDVSLTAGPEPVRKSAPKPLKVWGKFPAQAAKDQTATPLPADKPEPGLKGPFLLRKPGEAKAKAQPVDAVLLAPEAAPIAAPAAENEPQAVRRQLFKRGAKADAAVKAERPTPPRLLGQKTPKAPLKAEPIVPLPVVADVVATAETPVAAPAEEKQPKTVRRQIFKRNATTHSFAGQLHGTYGTYDAQGRLFAGDYLRQTNEAFEAAHFKGKGPKFSNLRLSDSHRAERLFMMATRTAGEDPSTALAALWQAVEEDSADAVAWLRLAHCYLELGDTARAQRILEPLQAQAEKADLPVIVAAAANSRGKLAAKAGDTDGARKLLATAMDAAASSDNPFLLGTAAANLGLVEAARGKLEPAREHLAKGIKRLDACEERVSSAQFRMALGTVLRGLGDAHGAEKVWTEASETLHTAKLADQAAVVDGWLKGEAPPSKVTL